MACALLIFICLFLSRPLQETAWNDQAILILNHLSHAGRLIFRIFYSNWTIIVYITWASFQTYCILEQIKNTEGCEGNIQLHFSNDVVLGVRVVDAEAFKWNPVVKYIQNSNLPKLPAKDCPGRVIQSTDDIKCFSRTLTWRKWISSLNNRHYNLCSSTTNWMLRIRYEF